MQILIRPVITIVLSIGLIGWGYWITSTQPDGAKLKSADLSNDLKHDSLPNYSVELLRTFTAEYSLDSLPANADDISVNEILLTDQASLQILFEGYSLFESFQPVEPQQRIFIENIPGVRIGQNEIFVLARLQPTDNPQMLQAMVGRVKVGERVISEGIYTSHTNSSLIYGTLVFEGVATDE